MVVEAGSESGVEAVTVYVPGSVAVKVVVALPSTMVDSTEVAVRTIAEYVKFDERYLRPTEVDALIGDASKARDQLGWSATVDGVQLAKLMVDADVEALEHEGRPWIDGVSLESWGLVAR